MKLAVHSTLQTAGVLQCAVWEPKGFGGLTRNPNKGIAKIKHTHTHTHTLGSIATYSVKMTEYKNKRITKINKNKD